METCSLVQKTAIQLLLPFHLFGKNKTMWSDDNVRNNRHTSSSSSSSSRFTNRKKTTEDEWKDISLNTSQGRSNKSREEMEPKGSFRRMLLQEFLARPFKEQHQQQQQQRSSEAPDQHTEMDMSPFGGASHHPPATILSLNSSPDQFHYLDSVGLGTNPLRLQPHHYCGGGSNPPFMAPSPPSNTFEAIGSSFCKKRVPESLESSGDGRHKRMIKNRESAARSRARKQAYTNELELEVAHLLEENARLRKHQQELLLAASAPAPTKTKLQRTSTAPF